LEHGVVWLRGPTNCFCSIPNELTIVLKKDYHGPSMMTDGFTQPFHVAHSASVLQLQYGPNNLGSGLIIVSFIIKPLDWQTLD
jgi:hypothetical protein